MKFSVVTISFNQAQFLERTITSVLSQKGVDLEYIIVDPGSTDGSRDIIEKYRSRLTKIIYEKDKGPADGLNKGLQAATGDYFYYLNSDDEISPNAFREAAAYLAKDPVDLLYGNGFAINTHSQILRKIFSTPVFSPGLCARGIATMLQPSSFIRTDKMREIGGFNIENRANWDSELAFDIARAGGRIRRVQNFWGRFRLYPACISGSGLYLEKINQQRRRMAQKINLNPDCGIEPLKTKLMWIGLRLIDLHRWPTYLQGRFSPVKMAEKASA